jgi:hypothetical protein
VKLKRLSDTTAVVDPRAAFWSPDRRFEHEHPEAWSSEASRLLAERRHLTYALRFGPNSHNALSDEQLRAYWEAKGRAQGELDRLTGEPTGIWSETSFAYHRFVKGLSVADAHAAAEEADARESAAAYLERFGVPSTRR